MASNDLVEMNGEITNAFPGGTFKVLTDKNTEVMCKPAGKLRIHQINLVVGDKVIIQVSPYDMSNGRIVRRM